VRLRYLSRQSDKLAEKTVCCSVMASLARARKVNLLTEWRLAADTASSGRAWLVSSRMSYAIMNGTQNA